MNSCLYIRSPIPLVPHRALTVPNRCPEAFMLHLILGGGRKPGRMFPLPSFPPPMTDFKERQEGVCVWEGGGGGGGGGCHGSKTFVELLIELRELVHLLLFLLFESERQRGRLCDPGVWGRVQGRALGLWLGVRGPRGPGSVPIPLGLHPSRLVRAQIRPLSWRRRTVTRGRGG